MARESKYQSGLIKRIKERFPGCTVLKNDSSYLQGVPDLLVLNGDKWAMLEVKASEESPSQPNQPHYIEKFGEMSFASFIYPENEEEVMSGLQQALGTRRKARVSKR